MQSIFRFFHDISPNKENAYTPKCHQHLTVHDMCLLRWGLEPTQPAKISGTTEGTTLQVSPDVGIYKEAQDKENLWHNLSGL